MGTGRQMKKINVKRDGEIQGTVCKKFPILQESQAQTERDMSEPGHILPKKKQETNE
jgi:hypothetical protein